MFRRPLAVSFCLSVAAFTATAIVVWTAPRIGARKKETR